MKRALAARPDLRAAELTVEAAAARLGWEESRILTLTAVLDANGEGKRRLRDRAGNRCRRCLCSTAIREDGCAGRPSCNARRQRTSRCSNRWASTCARPPRCSIRRRQSRAAWGERIVTPLRSNLADAEKSFSSGESSYLFVLENSRRLIEARLRERELAADEQRAQARIERASGTVCHAVTGAAK